MKLQAIDVGGEALGSDRKKFVFDGGLLSLGSANRLAYPPFQNRETSYVSVPLAAHLNETVYIPKGPPSKGLDLHVFISRLVHITMQPSIGMFQKGQFVSASLALHIPVAWKRCQAP